MKKEVITVKDGKQFKDDIEKILKQAKGKELYIDDELVKELRETEDLVDDTMKFLCTNGNDAGYSGILSKTNMGFYKIHAVSGIIKGKIYSSPLIFEEIVLIILA